MVNNKKFSQKHLLPFTSVANGEKIIRRIVVFYTLSDRKLLKNINNRDKKTKKISKI